MNRSALFFGLSSVVALAGVVAACSSTTTTTETTTPEAGTVKEGGSSEAGKDSSTSDIDSSTAPTGDQACAAEATLPACAQCCVQNHTAGYKVFQDSLLNCACKGTGTDGGTAPCATECAATACKATPAQPDATCTMCLQTAIGMGGACQEALTTDCTANADCVAEQKCIGPCQKKPNQ